MSTRLSHPESEPVAQASGPPLHLPQHSSSTPWLGLESLRERDNEFKFVLISDRTGLARPGVFERGIEVANLLRPDFVMQIGDEIEGYTEDLDEIAEQWAEFDGITEALEVPLFRVPGNHDVSNHPMRDEWLRRYGMLHYHFRYRDVLFVVLDTQDPPVADAAAPSGADGQPADSELDLQRLRELQLSDPSASVAMIEGSMDWNGRMPARISDEQLAWVQSVLAENADVRWTVVCMHMPIWQGEHPAFDALRAALGERPYTMFSGHVHNYRRTVIDGRDHIRLGPTGGLWVLSGDEGNFDHVTFVTMTSDGPHIANVVLDGVLGVDGGSFAPQPRLSPLPDSGVERSA